MLNLVMMKLILISFGVLLTFMHSDARKIETTPNPGCDKCGEKNLRVLQVTSNGTSDTIVYLLSTFGPPSLLTARFNGFDPIQTVVDWNCMKLMSQNCVNFSKKPDFSSTITLYRVIEYDDAGDTSEVSNFRNKPESVRNINLAEVQWWPLSANYSEPRWQLIVNSTNDKWDIVTANNTSAFLSIDFRFFDQQSRTDSMPSILHTDSTGMFDIQMANLSLHFNSSRFALEVVIVSDSLPDSSDESMVSSVDDEYSPGVFEVFTWDFNSDAVDDLHRSYLHYKPVCYTDTKRTLEKIQPAHFSKVRFFNYDEFMITNSGGLNWAYYGSNVRLLNVQSANLSVGSFQDGFYTAYNFTSFTAVHGVGQPVYDVMSAEVIAAISVGVGVPAILIVVAVTVVIVRMIKKKREVQAELLVNEQ